MRFFLDSEIINFIGAYYRFIYGNCWRTIARKKKFTFNEYLNGPTKSNDWFDFAGHKFVNKIIGISITGLIILLLISFTSCRHENKSKIDNESIKKLVLVHFDSLSQIPKQIISITKDKQLILELYKPIYKKDSVKICPFLYTKKIEDANIEKIENFICKSKFLVDTFSFKTHSPFDYSLYISSSKRHKKIEQILFDNLNQNQKGLILFVESLVDTIQMTKFDYIEFHNNNNLDIPPFPFDNFIKMNND